MKTLFAFALIFVALPSPAYIMPTKTILQKTVENAGQGIYSMEQEVVFSSGDKQLSVKETWLIEGDRTMRLSVQGLNELSGLKAQFVYNGVQKWSYVDGQRKSENVSSEFLEKYFNFRKTESLASALISSKIIPSHALQGKSLPRKASDIKYEPDSWVRYSRTNGVVNYALGVPTPVGQTTEWPGIWIEQDMFVIRKLRLPSQVEVIADDYNSFSRGLHYPKTRIVRWNQHTATIKLISAARRNQTAPNLFQASSIDIPTNLAALPESANHILEFYKRFR